jgi:HK97 family phage major capsid protein
LAGQPVTVQGRPLNSGSERDKALAGVWAKFQLMVSTPRIAGSAQRAWEMLSDHEKGMLSFLCEEEEWDDSLDNKERRRKGYPGGVKALIDDATSGGLEAAPIVFDDRVIEAPLLNGELYPLVNEIPLDRGRRIEGVSTDTVTGSWGGVDDTAVTLFTTTSYVAAFDTTVYRWEGAIRIGLDFLSDSPIDFGAHITRQYGERLLEDLDDVIAVGNGTTQPEGIMNHAGVTSVAFGAATTLTAYETLRFSVSKQEHKSAGATAVFCGNETSYRRAIGIPVGASDVRRVFEAVKGPNYDGYSILQRPYKINGSMANTQVFYAVMNRYRMYRRRGLTVRTSTEGDTLLRNNELLIVVMARFGGQLERAACAALTTTAAA